MEQENKQAEKSTLSSSIVPDLSSAADGWIIADAFGTIAELVVEGVGCIGEILS